MSSSMLMSHRRLMNMNFICIMYVSISFLYIYIWNKKIVLTNPYVTSFDFLKIFCVETYRIMTVNQTRFMSEFGDRCILDFSLRPRKPLSQALWFKHSIKLRYSRSQSSHPTAVISFVVYGSKIQVASLTVGSLELFESYLNEHHSSTNVCFEIQKNIHFSIVPRGALV